MRTPATVTASVPVPGKWNIKDAQQKSQVTLCNDGDMDEAMRTAVLNFMIENMEDHRDECGELNLTTMAEEAADNFDHDEWIDNQQSDVWDIAVIVEELDDRGEFDPDEYDVDEDDEDDLDYDDPR